MRPLGLGGGAARENSGDLAGELSRGVAAKELGVERARCGCSLAAGTGPATGRGGGRWRSVSGEPTAWPGQPASVGAIGSPSGGRSSTCLR
jgi:hypothetical protein